QAAGPGSMLWGSGVADAGSLVAGRTLVVATGDSVSSGVTTGPGAQAVSARPARPANATFLKDPTSPTLAAPAAGTAVSLQVGEGPGEPSRCEREQQPGAQAHQR